MKFDAGEMPGELKMQDEEVLGKAYDARLMRRLIRYLRPYRKYVFFAFVLLLFESGHRGTVPRG